MMIYIEIAIALFGITAFGFLAANRIFIGCVFGVIYSLLWMHNALYSMQIGALVILGIQLVIYILGMVTRWPRRPVLVDEHDEHETESIG